MTTTSEDTVVYAAARTAGLSTHRVSRLWRHATTVYLLPAEQIIARIKRGIKAGAAAGRAVAVTRWLCAQGFPATAPVDNEQPVYVDDYVVTFWRYYPQNYRTSPEPFHLGGLLRQLHQLAPPPVELPVYRPLARFTEVVKASSFLSVDDQDWLLTKTAILLDTYHRLDFPLGLGHVHGDAYPGNLLWDGDRALLGDWDETAIGARELDLVNTHQGVRFGRTAQQLRAFNEAYGYDVTTWPGFQALREIRDLHTLGPYIRLADQRDEQAAQQLRHRIETLRQGNTSTLWTARLGGRKQA